jgi:hypothetical protein
LKKECCDSDYEIFGTKERRAKSKGKICCFDSVREDFCIFYYGRSTFEKKIYFGKTIEEFP